MILQHSHHTHKSRKFKHGENYETFEKCWKKNIDWSIIYCFTSHSRIFHSHEDVTNASEGLQNLGLCSTLRAFEQGGIFIVPHLLWQGTSFFSVSSEGSSHSVASRDTRKGMLRTYSNAGSKKVQVYFVYVCVSLSFKLMNCSNTVSFNFLSMSSSLYQFDIVNIAMLTMLIRYWVCIVIIFPHVHIIDIAMLMMLIRYWVYIVCIIIISSMSTSYTCTSQCCTISYPHRVNIVYHLSCLHCSHRWHRNVDNVDMISSLHCLHHYHFFHVHIINIAMLYDI